MIFCDVEWFPLTFSKFYWVFTYLSIFLQIFRAFHWFSLLSDRLFPDFSVFYYSFCDCSSDFIWFYVVLMIHTDFWRFSHMFSVIFNASSWFLDRFLWNCVDFSMICIDCFCDFEWFPFVFSKFYRVFSFLSSSFIDFSCFSLIFIDFISIVYWFQCFLNTVSWIFLVILDDFMYF